MITILIWLATALGLVLALFTCYVAIMSMKTLKAHILELHFSVRWAAYTVLAIGLVLNVAFNWTIMTVAFWEIPKELLTTDRVKRHKRSSSGRRLRIANWLCDNWLKPFDAGHC